MTRHALPAALVGALLLATNAEAQIQRVQAPADGQETTVYALTDARIVVMPGRVMERGTILIRDGRIEAVGPQVAIPADAHRLDMTGHTVYPGLIDVASTLGLPPGGSAGAGDGNNDDAAGVPGLQARRLAADVYRPDDSALDALRAIGVTTVGLAFKGGVLPGRSAALNLGAGDPHLQILRSPVAVQVALEGRRGGYPATLMATQAYLRQAFLDAGHYRLQLQAFARNPSGGPRPVHTAEQQALLPAVSGELAVWIEASRENDLKRMMAFAEEMGLDYVLLGAQEGYRVVDELAAEGRPVIVSLDFPAPGAVTGRAFHSPVTAAPGQAMPRAAADSMITRALHANPATLLGAGIPVALASHGLFQPADLMDRVRLAMEAGLSADDALGALTLTPARLLGLEAVLGSIEAGKLANLAVLEGDLFAEDAQVRHVFVEGRRFDIPDREPTPAAAPGEVNVSGNWHANISSPMGAFSLQIRLQQEGNRVTGQLTGPMGPAPVQGDVDGAAVRLSSSMAGLTLRIHVTVDDNRMSGTVSSPDFDETIPFTATRTPGGDS